MNKKNILILVSILLLGASGYLMYHTFGPSPTLSGPESGIPVQVASADTQVLPYGNKLDFTEIGQYNVNRKKFPYPQVSSGEVGVSPHDLIK